ALLRGQASIRAWIAIKYSESDEIEEAEQRCAPECASPSEIEDGDGDHWRANHVGEFRRRVEDRRRKSTLIAWEPVARRFGIAGKCRCFGDTKEDACREDAPEAAGERGQPSAA